ncbi:glycosyltransferase family 2 protein [Kocuria massiliensis]|jgi:glycosyltransferase involved in cell wall biosynthesis|uniref:glycosyltransferase family 2 protein n=1 Tax=Kocuria massiliensis TaxID=1926282 RepID=UPI000660BB6B|nr:glycosyltransferase family 2 protein [Kocuria massiliensis]
MFTPDVVVVIPTYRRGSALEKTLTSVATQSYERFTAKVVSDGPPDEAFRVIAANMADDNRFEFIVAPRTGTAGLTRQYGIDRSDAPLIAFLDHDDTFHEDWLANGLERLKKTSCSWVVASAVYERQQIVEPPGIPLHQITWSPALQTLNPLFEPSRVILTRHAANITGPWSNKPWGLEDWDYWWRMAHQGFVPEFLSAPPNTLTLHDDQRRHCVVPRYFAPVLRGIDKKHLQEIQEKYSDPSEWKAVKKIFYQHMAVMMDYPSAQKLSDMDPMQLPQPVMSRDHTGWFLGLPVPVLSKRHAHEISMVLQTGCGMAELLEPR